MLEKHISETEFTLIDPSARRQTPDPLNYFLISILSHKLWRTPRLLSLTIYHIRGLFSGGKLLWTGRSCEDFSPSLLLWLSSGNQWMCMETEEHPLLARGSTEPCTQLSHTLPSTGTLLLYSHSSVSPVLYSEVTLWGRFVAIGAIIAIIWLSSTNLSNVIVLQDQFLVQDCFLSAFLGNLGQQASHFSPEMEA